MQSHYVLFSGSEEDDAAALDDLEDNVVALFAPREGTVAAIIAAAAGPAEQQELAGEDEIRATFRAVMLERPDSTQRRHRLAPFAIAAGSVVGLVAGTAGLSAAAVLPPAANHVVARVLAQVGIDVAPTSTPAPAATANHSAAVSPPVTPAHSSSSTPSSAIGAGAPAVSLIPSTSVVSTCNVPVTVHGVRSNVEMQVTATNAAAALAATEHIQGKGNCSLNRGTPSTGSKAGGKNTGGGPAGSGTGAGTGGSGPSTGSGSSGTGSSKGTNKGHGNGGHHGKGRHGKRGDQGGTATGTGTGTGTSTGAGTGTSTGSGTGTAPIGGATTTTTTLPSSGPVTSDDPIGSPS